MMRKAVILATALVIILFFAGIPVSGHEVDTSVNISQGGGEKPVIKCKWEQDDSGYLEDGDPEHLTTGSQFLPPCEFEGKKRVYYYAVVTDEEDNGDLKVVAADVYHPDGTFKYQVMMEKQIPKPTDDFVAAAEADLVTYNSAENFNFDEVLFELQKCTADIWMGYADLDYCQMGGKYQVHVIGYDSDDNPSELLINWFWYVPVACCEFDFDSVDYGDIHLCKNKWVAGDTIFGTTDFPTVRNIGNIPILITIEQDDMGFGQDSNLNWNVQFDARLGNTGQEPVYDPYEEITLPDSLPACHTEELDFSIHVIKGNTQSAPKTGKMWLGCIAA